MSDTGNRDEEEWRAWWGGMEHEKGALPGVRIGPDDGASFAALGQKLRVGGSNRDKPNSSVFSEC